MGFMAGGRGRGVCAGRLMGWREGGFNFGGNLLGSRHCILKFETADERG